MAAPENNTERDLYFVAFRLLLRDGGKLLVTHDIFGDWDLPGGRIRVSEFDSPIEDVIERKVREELGDEIKYKIGDMVATFRVERFEEFMQKDVRIFAVGYEATYLGGEIKLGDHHDKMKWVDINKYNPAEDFTGGWLKGLQEYLGKAKKAT